ncbi:MAG: LLM class flavin-dependent oxidoreductase [Acidimicrobiia bacterium]|nr:LLM class flavin-dependent oxidoreductase [Acidimicrobiia bacterium]
MKLSVAFPPVPETPDHIVLAEALGYDTAWVYDTPALQLDCWMTMALAAVRTERIRLGPGVLIPSLRHPMVTAAAIATLVGLVGAERVVVGVGTGFTGRRAMGQKPLRWKDMPRMVDQVRRLLAGEIVEVDGRPARMLHGRHQGPDRPIEVPWVLGVNGPRGLATAIDLGCGVFTSRPRPDAVYDRIDDVILLGFGTILDDGESPGSDRVLTTAGPGVMVAYHAFLEQGDDRLDRLPNAERFVELASTGPPELRHLSLHAGHLTELNDIDRQVLVGEAMSIAPLVCEPDELGERLAGLGRQGITEVAFQPMGDIERELRAFAEAAGL